MILGEIIMKYKWLKKSIALATMSAFLLQPCTYVQEAFAAEESGTVTENVSSTEYSVERLATGYTKVSAEYTAPKYEYKGGNVELPILSELCVMVKYQGWRELAEPYS